MWYGLCTLGTRDVTGARSRALSVGSLCWLRKMLGASDEFCIEESPSSVQDTDKYGNQRITAYMRARVV